ncbi:MAG TPA: NAD(P)/FAD-dependent oxidoreductase [Anaerolineales bacterium]|nr:NAD(P)/FAD-dependent oxidoreductase [Anaerolineales bacterium]
MTYNADIFDVTIIGSGPNGLSAAIRLAQAGLSVLVLEGHETIGGGTRSRELTKPGYTHDICSAIHPLGLASPFLRTLPLQQYGLEWVQPEVPFAHALAPDDPILIHQDLNATAHALGPDGRAWKKLFAPFVENWQALMDDFLGPLPLPPKHPILMARFGLTAIQSATGLAHRTFRGAHARAAFGGMAAHSMMPLEWLTLGGFGMMLGVLAHAVGWPMARGGSQQIANALAAYFQALGGKIITGQTVTALDQLPPTKAILFDTSPRGVLSIVGNRLAPGYARQLQQYQYGGGVCKVDWALSEPIPWKSPAFTKAATIHLGGSLEEMRVSERAIWEGKIADRPYVLLVQQSQFDSTRAPAGKHTAWAYCHTPHGWAEDVSGLIEQRIEQFAPGFREVVLAKSVRTAVQMEAYNPNYIGGDINGGVQNLRQFFTRPAVQWNPYRIPGNFGAAKAYLCSSSTPPGGGVHGMCGFYAAETALKDLT